MNQDDDERKIEAACVGFSQSELAEFHPGHAAYLAVKALTARVDALEAEVGQLRHNLEILRRSEPVGSDDDFALHDAIMALKEPDVDESEFFSTTWNDDDIPF